ncbi:MULTISPECIES: hypothetical protein [Cysteiniphilum]|uniref:Uncharacterized protein n=1 Tax=Cysteiniphilum litorale TaxID=2056700 RepID=A0A8J3E825_9GAMM|nr:MULTISPECIES: hypothetical protein [Cysteiniphilum]GGF91414.1 hypothetical protein GCM10010995_05820 [Cysteiniphilum litorale]
MIALFKKNVLRNNYITLKDRLDDVFAYDKVYAQAEAKNAVKPTQTAIINTQSNIVSITPFLKRDVSNLGGFTA